MEGVTENTFEADRSITRAEWASLLVRSLGLAQTGKSSFRDVLPEHWYYTSVSAAVEAGIVNGYPDGSFRPDAPVTREEMAAMLVRALAFAGSPAAFLTAKQAEAVLDRFNDSGSILWATQETAQAVQAGILQGHAAATLGASAPATRAEAATMLKRFLEKCGFIE
ncbi:Endo-1,4-beta-xylanase A precursor [compost metagenome]